MKVFHRRLVDESVDVPLPSLAAARADEAGVPSRHAADDVEDAVRMSYLRYSRVALFVMRYRRAGMLQVARPRLGASSPRRAMSSTVMATMLPSVAASMSCCASHGSPCVPR